ncbi:hypothetical protein [Flavicella sp.]|uniref:hypothetical protein n=1 Tax=Flavicella sp. TaxID=2957742 RepID=UPI00301B4B46
MKKIGIVIADGVGYRNFIMSDFINEAKLKFDVIYIYSGLLKSVYNENDIEGIKFRELDIYRESKKSWFYRKLKEVAHLQNHKSFFGINTSLQNGIPKSLKPNKAKLIKLIYILTSVFKNEKYISFFEKLQYKSFQNDTISKAYVAVLKEDKLNHLFFTHQRPANLAPLLGAAKTCGISTSSFIFSWDNLISKGRMLGSFNSFFVWSDLMKSELHYFYPKVKKEDIKIVGTPQFEPYVLDRYYRDEKYFYNRFDFDDSKKTIYYSCGDVSTSKSDPLYITIIAKAIRDKRIQSLNFVVRTSPAEGNSRFLDIKNEYPFIKWNFPKWNLTRENHTETWSQRVPKFEDLCDLRALLTFSDININMCSTMGLDSMIFDKPVINPVFGNDENGLYNDQKYLKYDHYKNVVESRSVVIATNENELIEAINNSLRNPAEASKQRQEILKLEISKPLKGTSKRIVKELMKF